MIHRPPLTIRGMFHHHSQVHLQASRRDDGRGGLLGTTETGLGGATGSNSQPWGSKMITSKDSMMESMNWHRYSNWLRVILIYLLVYKLERTAASTNCRHVRVTSRTEMACSTAVSGKQQYLRIAPTCMFSRRPHLDYDNDQPRIHRVHPNINCAGSVGTCLSAWPPSTYDISFFWQADAGSMFQSSAGLAYHPHPWTYCNLKKTQSHAQNAHCPPKMGH